MGPTWVLSAPDGPRVDPKNLAIRGANNVIDDIRLATWRPEKQVMLVSGGSMWRCLYYHSRGAAMLENGVGYSEHSIILDI